MNENNVEKYLHKHLNVRDKHDSSKILDLMVTEISKDGKLMKVTGDIKDLLIIEDFEENFVIVDILTN